MARGEIVINESFCRGCGLCEHFCNQGCIEILGDRFTPQGYMLPLFAHPEKCNACGICGRLCPHFSIEVYRLVEKKTPAAAG
ncbi:MAG: ferredoxin family protein [Chloroflexi bacterium]|nr:ferredoxin family protein [Chloroflexota bacterium]